MIGSIHVADVGLPAGAAFRPPKPDQVPGLHWSNGGATSVLGPSVLPKLKPSRVGWAAFWEDDEALDAFLASGHRLVDQFDGGWSCRLRPVRAYGEWPGLPGDLPAARRVETDGPVAVLTLARLKVRRAVEFFRTSARAEEAVQQADGLIWTMGFGRPPFLATISLWESAEATMAYAFDGASQAHADAIGANRRNPFHARSAFVRFPPYDSRGALASEPSLSPTALDRFA